MGATLGTAGYFGNCWLAWRPWAAADKGDHRASQFLLLWSIIEGRRPPQAVIAENPANPAVFPHRLC